MLAFNAPAQTFGGGVAITGTTNAVLLTGGSRVTNTFYITFPSRTVTLSGVTSTNETAVFSYALASPGSTNVFIVASVTNSFAAGTNNGSWSTNLPQMQVAIPLVQWAQGSIGSFTNQIYVP